MMKLLVGLGNPGPEYESTRHNAGFWWIDELAQRHKLTWSVEKNSQSLVARLNTPTHTVWLLKPQTFMNLSGRSVAALARFYKIQAQEVLVIHDELDIVPGQAKLKLGGSHAGHNGLRDIHAQLGTDQYWRLRLGIGHPGHKAEVVNWVLKKPSPEHRDAIQACIDRTLQAAPELMRGDTPQATKLIHTSTPQRPAQPPRPPRAQPQAPNTPVKAGINTGTGTGTGTGTTTEL